MSALNPFVAAPGETVPAPAPASSGSGQNPFLAPTQTVTSAPSPWLQQDPVSRFVRATADEATFGVSNWAIAGAHVLPGAIASMFGGAPLDVGSDFTVSRDQARADNAQYAVDNPTGADIAKGVGVLGQVLGTAGTDALAAPLIRGGKAALDVAAPTAANVAARGAVTGALTGAASGLGNAPPGSSAGDVARSTAIGAGVGALAGGAIAPVTQGFVDLAHTVAAGTSMRTGASDLGKTLADGNRVLPSAAEAGASTADSVSAAAQTAHDAASQLYTAAGQSGATVHPAVTPQLPQAVHQEAVSNGLDLTAGNPNGVLPNGTVVIDPGARAKYPAAASAMDEVNKLAAAKTPLPVADSGGRPSLLNTQTTINGPGIQATTDNKADQWALGQVRHGWTNAFSALDKVPGAVQGSPGAVANVSEANAAWRHYSALTSPTDKPGQTIANWKANNSTGGAVAADIFGTTQFPTAKAVSNTVNVVNSLKNEFGAGSQEFNAVQQGLFLKASGNAADGTPLPAAQVKRNLLGLFQGVNQPLGEAIFTPAQKAAILRFANSIPDSGTTRLGAVSLKAMHLAGTVLGGALGLHFLPEAALPLAGAVGYGTGGILSKVVARDAQNPLLYKPLFAARVGRAVGETIGASAGGTAAAALPASATDQSPAEAPSNGQ